MPTGVWGTHTAWTASRIARLGFLVGSGWDAERIAADPAIACKPNNVYRQTQRFGLAFRQATTSRLSNDVANHLDTAARKRGASREDLIERLLTVLGSEPHLIDNVLDDATNR